VTETPLPATDDAALLATSKVVTTVFEQILAAVHEGTLLPGQRISDAELATQFGVSRTPVREALQRLREIGIIEASASRFTRVADVTPIQTAQAFVVWLALYRALVEEVVPIASAEALDGMVEDHDQFLASLVALDTQRIATTNFGFFSRLPPESANTALQRAIISVVHIIRLGSLHLPDYIDFAALGRSQELLIDAVRTGDLAMAREAMDVLGGIEVPLA
jgi:DNA-binding GntR family transcriptional regulator